MAALLEVERRLDADGCFQPYSLDYRIGVFQALDELPRNLAKMKGDRVSLDYTNVADLSRLADVPQTRALDLGEKVVDISALAKLPILEELQAREAPVNDISALEACRALKYVELRVERLCDLSPLASLPNLERLNLWGYAGQLLPTMPALQHLSIAPTKAGFDLSELAGTPNLRVFSGYSLAEVTGRLPALPRLEMFQGPKAGPENLDAFAGCPRLETLSVHDPRIRDLAPLAHCRKLQDVDVSKTSVSDVAPIVGLPELRSIDVSGTLVEDVTPLSFHKGHLWGINAENTPIASLRGWNRKARVDSLGLGGTKVTDIEPLAGMSLRSLSLRNTPISDLTGLGGLYLASLDISGTQVASFDEIIKHRSLVYDEPEHDPRERASFRFADTPLARSDERLIEISRLSKPQLALRKHLGLEKDESTKEITSRTAPPVPERTGSEQDAPAKRLASLFRSIFGNGRR